MDDTPLTLIVNLYATFRLHAGEKTFTLQLPPGSTLMNAVRAIISRYPVLSPHWLDAEGNLHAHVHCFINNQEFMTLQEGVATRLQDGDALDFFPPVVGG